MKILRIGDMHVQVKNLEESKTLMSFIYKTAKELKVSRIEFLGDLTHHHAIVRVEVLDFWRKSLSKLSSSFSVVILVGNHDQPGSREKEQQMNSLKVLEGNKQFVVDEPIIIDCIGYIPHMSDKKAFLEATQDLYEKGANKLLVAHQTFTGAIYENGFYAEDGIDPGLVPQESIISGHIHKQQQIGKCFYPGTPRWDTMADANEEKGVWLYEHDDVGSVKSKTFISTKEVVTPIVKHTLSEGDREVELNEKAKNYIELIGSTAWIVQMKKKYKGLAAIRARPTDRKGINTNKDLMFSISDYLDKVFRPIDGVSKEEIFDYLKEVSNV